MLPSLPETPFLYPITDRRLAGGREIGDIVEKLCAAGVRIIQIREKEITTREFVDLARKAVDAAEKHGALIIINDRPDVAIYSGASGVHLGEHELPPRAAREVLGPEKIIGVSCHSADDVRRADREPVNYIAVGPIFSTRTTQLHYKVVGTELIREARAITALPLVAIGGIDETNISSVVAAGADGVAVISAVIVPHGIKSCVKTLSIKIKKP